MTFVRLTEEEARKRRQEIVDHLGGEQGVRDLRARASLWLLGGQEMAMHDELEDLDYLLRVGE